jgi:solute carrier family 35 protein E1
VLPLVALISVWWGASAWNSIAAKQVVLHDPSAVPLMAIMSNVPGGVVWCFLWLYDRTILHQSMRQMIPLATCHAIGLYASYMGLVGANVSLVQAVKAIEPLLAMALSVWFLRKVPSFWSAVVAGAVVGGVMMVCVTDTTYTWTALGWVLISSISTQIRNQLMKRMQKQFQTKALSPSAVLWYSSPESTGLLMFVSASAYALPASVALAILSQFQFDPSTDQPTIPPLLKTLSGPLLLAGTMHFMYNMASFGVLSLVTPATHSLANTTKRAVVVGCAAIFLKESWTRATSLGMVIILLGSTFYGYLQIHAKKSSPQQDEAAAARCRRVTIYLAPLLVLTLLVVPQYLNNVSLHFSTIFEASRSGDGAGPSISEGRTCLYHHVLLCLDTNERIQTKDFALSELDADVDSCVQAWTRGRHNASGHDELIRSPFDVQRSFPLNFLGRGELKDRVDWSIFRLGMTEAAQANLQQVCSHYFEGHNDKHTILQLPNWWDMNAALPSVSRQYRTAGSYLPPWYEMNQTEQILPGGYALPKGPVRGVRAATLPTGQFTPHVFKGVPNLGDCYNFYLLSLLSGKNAVQAAKKKKGPVVCAVGSIVGKHCEIIWGSGVLCPTCFGARRFKKNTTEVFAVRGPDTLNLLPRKQVRGRRIAFGDPGLLAPFIFPMPSHKEEEEADICLVPHYIDHKLPIIRNALTKKNNDGLSIRVLNIEGCSLDEYMQQMRGCKTIFSSSLHGLIFGLAYGIPGIRTIFSSSVMGGHFKFLDFYKGIGHPELYRHTDLRNSTEIPFAKLLKGLTNSSVPALNMEDLWNANPLHAETLGATRAEHLASARNFVTHLHELLPHAPYIQLSKHLGHKK